MSLPYDLGTLIPEEARSLVAALQVAEARMGESCPGKTAMQLAETLLVVARTGYARHSSGLFDHEDLAEATLTRLATHTSDARCSRT